MLIRWDKFARDNLDPPPSKRTGKRLIESGEVEGVAELNGWPWVDAEAWRRRGPQTRTTHEQALDLLS